MKLVQNMVSKYAFCIATKFYCKLFYGKTWRFVKIKLGKAK
ncbi:Hypothetical protein BN2458_PEG0727 [Helicobacter typhlonius]|uniref:Uncharacterized protein n=1 Tax=Helicobacter typhlonius TaxID=76936 RepID=A0A0S4PTM8_9HELI|nr:Hypothetical protein BN2458_PEG0727 [Helicobacter typhlonius]